MAKFWIFLAASMCGIVAVSCGKNTYSWCRCNVMNSGSSGRPRPPIDLLPPEFATLNGVNVQLSRHHIIPFSVFRTFSATAIRRVTNPTVRAYADSIIRHMMDHFADRNILNQALGTPPQRSTSAETISQLLHQYFAWMPGNIFYGPPSNMRLDDPGDAFDSSAIYIVGPEHFALLTRLRDLMVNFSNDVNLQTEENFVDIVTILLKLATMNPFSFNEHQWHLVGQNCRIKQVDCADPTPPPRHEFKRSMGHYDGDEEIMRQYCWNSLASYVESGDYLTNLNQQLNSIKPHRGRGLRTYDPLNEYCLASYTCKYLDDRYTALMIES